MEDGRAMVAGRGAVASATGTAGATGLNTGVGFAGAGAAGAGATGTGGRHGAAICTADPVAGAAGVGCLSAGAGAATTTGAAGAKAVGAYAAAGAAGTTPRVGSLPAVLCFMATVDFGRRGPMSLIVFTGFCVELTDLAPFVIYLLHHNTINANAYRKKMLNMVPFSVTI